MCDCTEYYDGAYAYAHAQAKDAGYVVTAVVRDGRVIPVGRLSYRLYCVLWCGFRKVRAALAREKQRPPQERV